MPGAIYFFPHNPYPARSGAHKRCLEVLAGLNACGHETIFASASLSSETSWTAEGRDHLLRNGASTVSICETTLLDRIAVRAARAYFRQMKIEPPISSILHTPPAMRRWFQRICRDFQPDIVVMSYAFWDGLLNSDIRRSTKCVIDTIDLFTINSAMRKKLKGHFPRGRLSAADISDAVLAEDFFSDLSVPETAAEYEVFDRYDVAICISPHERDLVGANAPHTRTLYIPMAHLVTQVANSYSGPALYTTGPNPLNTQGYFYFAKKVLPRLRKQIPEFELNVTGSVCDRLAPEAGVNSLGFVPDLQSLFESARFSICPVLGKTGQQVKIVEAMANGLPVVALEAGAAGSPIRHGVNGWIARDALEFADYCARLWQDVDVNRQMGAAARSTIASDFSPVKIASVFSQL